MSKTLDLVYEINHGMVPNYITDKIKYVENVLLNQFSKLCIITSSNTCNCLNNLCQGWYYLIV